MSKIAQKTPLKKHTEKITLNFNQRGGEVFQKVTRIRPTRDGKGGIQDGILLEKKNENLDFRGWGRALFFA